MELMQELKKNITLVVAIAIPLLMIILIGGSIYLPGLFIKPKYNFVYTTGDYYTNFEYYIQNTLLQKRPVDRGPYATYSNVEPKLYLYDVTKNEAKEISLEQAQALNLNSNLISPDGFEITYGSSGDSFFPFFFSSGSDYNSRYIQGHNVSKKLNLQLNGSYSYYEFRFLGWIN